MLLGLLSVLVLLLGTHYLIYRSVLSVFDVTHPRARRTLLLAFAVLAMSIPLAMLLHRLHGNAITTSFHTLSSFWLGLALHLVFFLLLAWLVHGISRLVRRPLAMGTVVPVAAPTHQSSALV